MHTTCYVAKLFQWYFHYRWWFYTTLQIFTPLPSITLLSHSKNQHFREVQAFQWFFWGSLFQSRNPYFNTQQKHLKITLFSLVLVCDKKFSGHCKCRFVVENRVTMVQGHILTTTPKDQSLNHLAEVGSQG